MVKLIKFLTATEGSAQQLTHGYMRGKSRMVALQDLVENIMVMETCSSANSKMVNEQGRANYCCRMAH